MTTTKITLIDRAYDIAHSFHTGQYRKDGKTPYIFHCIEVMRFLQKDCGIDDDNILATALLHDVLEDTDITPNELNEFFGNEITSIIDELTFYPDSCSKQYYLESFNTKSDNALVIKCADRLCNTLDFFYGNDQSYSIKYLEKANCLFEFIKKRLYIRANVKLAILGKRAQLENLILAELSQYKNIQE